MILIITTVIAVPLLPCYSYQYIYILHGVRSSTWHSFGRCTADVINRRINWQPLGLLPPPRHPQCQQLSLSGHTEGESSGNVTLKKDVSYTCSRSQRVTQHRKGSVCSLPVTGLTHRVSNQHNTQHRPSSPYRHCTQPTARPPLPWRGMQKVCGEKTSRDAFTGLLEACWHSEFDTSVLLRLPSALLWLNRTVYFLDWRRAFHAGSADVTLWQTTGQSGDNGRGFFFFFFLFPFYHSFKVFMRMTSSTSIYLYIYSLFIYVFIYL